MSIYNVGDERTHSPLPKMNAQRNVGLLIVSCDFEPLSNCP